MTTIKSKKPSTTDRDAQSNSPAVAIFQWLTYVFWGLTAVVSVLLVAESTELIVSGYGSDLALGVVIFFIAAAFVLLPLSLTFDYFFSRHERDHKTGISMVLMVIHAVLAALFAVTGLAVAVFSVASMVVFADDASEMVTLLAGAVAAMVLFGLIFIRIMKPATKTRLRLIVRTTLLLLISATLIWAIAGPATQVVIRQQDDRMVWALQSTSNVVAGYVAAESVLPEKLEDAVKFGFSGDTGIEALEKNLANGRITYTPNVLPPTVEDGLTGLYYEVCATFDYADESRNQFGYGITLDQKGFSEGFINISVDAGTNCYKMKHSMTDGMAKPL